MGVIPFAREAHLFFQNNVGKIGVKTNGTILEPILVVGLNRMFTWVRFGF